MPAKDLLSLISQRELLKGQLKGYLLHLKKDEPLTLEEAKLMKTKIQAVEVKFEGILEDMSVHLDTEDKIEVQVKASEQIFNLINESNTIVCKFIDEHITTSPIQSAVDESNQRAQVIRLSKLQLPMFNGSYEDWLPFRDQFSAAVINNNKLSGCEKLQYLKSSLKDDAFKLVSAIPLTDNNFQNCWDVIEKRYNNKRELSKVQNENPNQLRKLLDDSNQYLSLLRNLDRPVDMWDDLIVFSIIEKLDQETKREWTRKVTGTTIPSFSELLEFLENRIRGLISLNPKHEKVHREQKQTHATLTHTTKCTSCGDNHVLYRCPVFLQLPVSEKVSHVKSNHLCFNCLTAGHRVKNCRSQRTCRDCGTRHHSLIHTSRLTQGQSQVQTSTDIPINEVQSHHVSGFGVLLATAMVEVKDSTGSYVRCRAFLDPGSETSFITEKCLTTLGIPRTHCSVNITGVGASNVTRVKGQVIVEVKSCYNNFECKLDALVLPRVTGQLPSFVVGNSWKHWKHIRHLRLADEQFHQPREIDILIGADATARIYTGERILGPINEPVACASEFGWILQGPVGIKVNHAVVKSFHSVKIDESSVDVGIALQRFWELETIPTALVHTSEEMQAESHFVNRHSRDSTGRYIIPLPYNTNLSILGFSRESALKRLLSTERRLNSNPQWMAQYKDFLQEYQKLGHMEEVPPGEIGEREESPSSTFYLPHHFVTKEDSTTSKFRVVFDGSCPSSSGISLNKCLLVGPTVQPDVLSHLLRFRLKLISIKADIAKMYRQFLVTFQDSNRQRILWRDSIKDPIKEYRLKTVTYGTASAPFSATRALLQLAVDEGENFPLAATAIKNNFYVDDLLSGASTVEEALELQQQLTSVLGKAQLELRKWDSNSLELLNHIHSKQGNDDHHLSSSVITESKTLGVYWNSSVDELYFKNFHITQATQVTRRTVLSEMARVFDPLGLISPVTVNVKIFFQLLWRFMKEDGKGLAWNDPIPSQLFHHWEIYRDGMAKISNIQVPRCLTLQGANRWELHTFSDASERAYSAVVYLRSLNGDVPMTVRLITAKTRVAPLSAKSIPRLELCGAHLASKLAKCVLSSFDIDAELHFWTDSEIVLRWISSPSRRWSVFVANQVAKIQEVTASGSWRFVAGTENPADCASRGLTMDELIHFSMWWNGPGFLSLSELKSFQLSNNIEESQLEESKKYSSVFSNFIVESILERYSSLSRLQRVTAWMLRFIQNMKRRGRIQSKGASVLPLSVSELDQGLKQCIQWSQQQDFSQELHCLKERQISSTSRILSLNPILMEGVIRIGGRLGNSNLPLAAKHPIILSGKSHLAKLIILQCHLRNLHAGERLVTSTLRQQYWITNSRNSVKGVIRNCIRCKKVRGKTMEQIMGSLPVVRVTESSPFTHTGVDYAGPFQIQRTKGRGNTQFKAYLCIFVCLAVKAVHIEYVTDLTTEAFINTLRRFIARRGKPSVLYSDCGTNFVGADSALKKFISNRQNQEQLSEVSADEGIEWRFNPPSAPHQGGIWEAAVKSAKFHLKRVVGSSVLTLEEFATLLSQAEAVLNSRPLHLLSQDLEDLSVLTPGHFLIGKPLNQAPQHDVLSIPSNRLSRWNRQQHMFQHFWKGWSKEYLHTLQERVKWKRSTPSLAVGDLVSIKDDFNPPLKWKMGRVVEIHPGDDNHVLVVTIKTMNGFVKRPVTKLVSILPQELPVKQQPIC